MDEAARASSMSAIRRGAPMRFLAVGVLNTLVGLLVIYSCKWLLGLGDVSANLIGYITALINSFFLNRAWTFSNEDPVLSAVVRFMIVFLLAYLLNLLTVLVAIDLFHVDSYVAQAIGVAPYTAFSYLGFRYFAFRPWRSPAA